MAAAMIKDRGLRKKLTQEAIPEKTPKKPSKRKSTPSSSKNDKKNEQNNNKRPKIQTGDPKVDLFSTYQPWVIQTYGDLAKTKTITLKKYARILRTLRGEECNSSDSSKFRFWVKAKGFHVGRPTGYDAKPADGIVCRYSVADAEGCARGPDGQEIYTGSQNDPPLYIPTPPLKNAPNQEPVYRKVAIVENFFDIIYTVHVELEGRPGKHAGQKRTYRTITETYAFLPREAVTRFLTGCAECARRPRSASPPPLPTPSPSPTRHPTYLPFLPHCAPDYTRNWESEIDAAQNYSFEPKFDYTDLQPLKKVESPKPAEEEEPTYIELTSKKSNGFDATTLFNRSSSVEPFREEEPVRTDPEIDKDDSVIDVEDVRSDSPPPLIHQKKEELNNTEEVHSENTRAAEDSEVDNTDSKREKKYNPLDVANLTSKDPPKSRSPPRKKLLPSSIDYLHSYGRLPKPWRPDGGVFYGGDDMDYSVPITTAYLKHMRSMGCHDRMDLDNKDNLTPEPVDMNDDDNYSSRNGDMTESGTDSMADLWASYHSALGLGSKPPKPPTPLATGHSVRPTPAHLTSVQAEHILAQACENESLNAKRMRLGLDPVSQPMPTVPTPMAIDTTATSAVASSFLSLYSGAMSSPATSVTSSANTTPASAHGKAPPDTTRPSASPTLDSTLLNNNSLKLDNANGNTGSKTASPASSPAPLFRPTFPNTFGNPPTFGRQSSSTNPTSALSSTALLSTLTALPPTGVGVNAAMAAYQSALLSAMAAHTHTFPNLTAPTDLSLKTSVSTPLHATSTSSSLSGSGSQKSLLSHKLSGAEVGAVRQLITGYRESAAFLLRSADELEALLLNQP
ncbi:uncharacterized protein LOC113403506 isoform X7 [Vanessa tameamea]|uniref:Uncharacterized protein LOC113403506 isoform X7 n=1 Tax=Vanessa tameamea TaxID=334116 RepID=A0ABM4AUL1_VANTA